MQWGEYWAKVCAPKLKARKRELGRKVPERQIAAAVEAATGKPSGRVLVAMWLRGEREPFISQFFALCKEMDMDPIQVLSSAEKQTSRDRLINRRSILDSKGKIYKNPLRRTA